MHVLTCTPPPSLTKHTRPPPATGAELEVQEKLPLLEWLANNYKKFGCTLEFVTNRSQEGSQFCRWGAGGGGQRGHPQAPGAALCGDKQQDIEAFFLVY